MGARLFLLVLLTAGAAHSQAPVRILKVDPPNWYAALPKPMLLIRGENLSGATFALSDRALHIETATVSGNGHWAQLWLSASPAKPETVRLMARRGAEHAEQPYTFAARRPATDGMSGFRSDDVMYLIMTDRFADGDLTNDGPLARSSASSPEAAAERAKPRGWHGGDLRGIEQHLDYLQQLGITTVWPTPVYQNHGPQAYHGYHATDYYSVDEHYGTLDDLKSLAKALHARGMKLVLDTVPNHVGPFHPWVRDEPAPDWFHGTLAHHMATQYDFNYLVDPHSTEGDRAPILDGWFVDQLPDMNTESPAVAQYLRQNAVWWIEQTGADGLRIDTFAYVGRPFWREYTRTLHDLFPHVTEVGEVLHGDPKITSFFAGGRANTAADGTVDTGLYTPFDFPSFFALVDALTGSKPMSALAEVFRSDWLYPHPERLVTLLGNHDTRRFLSQPGASPAGLRMAFGLLATMRGMPQLYYGDEVAMTGENDPDNRKDMPGGFPGDSANAFLTDGRTEAQQEMYRWVQSLMQLRRRTPALRQGYQEDLFADAESLAFVRTEADGGCVMAPTMDRYLVVLNAGAMPRDVSVNVASTKLAGCTHYEPVLGTEATVSKASEILHVQLAGATIGVFKASP